MATTTTEGAGTAASGAGEEADVVNPIVFFDITLGGEFFFLTPFLYTIPLKSRKLHAFFDK